MEAGRRLKRALRILQEAAIDDAITESVQELAGWLEDFSDEAMIELDYASVSDMFEGDELADDHSAADVASCLDSLASGDLIRAGRIFATLSERWGRARSLEAVN